MGICWGRPSRCANASTPFQSESQPSESKKPNSNSKNPTSYPLETPPVSKSPVPSARSFNLNDLKEATKNFRMLLGEGGFGYVYKGWIDEKTYAPATPDSGIVVAIKKLKKESFQGHKEWLAEVTYLGKLHDENLVKLLGYCSEGNQKLLVYEYLQKGNLENHLLKRGVQPISWSTRVNIAIGVARGLTFLHGLETQVIYRDLKASNVLLDSDYKAKLSDFGLARNGPTGDNTHVSTKVVGTRGYAAPEYVATGHLSAKSDIYSFGVVMLELLTGRSAVAEDRFGSEGRRLVEWAKPFLSDKRRMLRIMDARLEGQYVKREAQELGAIALQCLHGDPRDRPTMAEILPSMENIRTPKGLSDHKSNDRSNVCRDLKLPPIDG